MSKIYQQASAIVERVTDQMFNDLNMQMGQLCAHLTIIQSPAGIHISTNINTEDYAALLRRMADQIVEFNARRKTGLN